MLRIAVEAGAETVIGENVPNLLTMNEGRERAVVEGALRDAGFGHVGWRVLNAREFGLPHQRRRAFLVASRDPAITQSLQRVLPGFEEGPAPPASAFYWTAGCQSICWSVGFSPTLKVGSSLSIPSPPAVFMGGRVRKMTAAECLGLQGFDREPWFDGIRDSDRYRMAGNAVARPVGHFVVGCLDRLDFVEGVGPSALATNLGAFLYPGELPELSARAASGLLRRLGRSGLACPAALRAALERLSTA